MQKTGLRIVLVCAFLLLGSAFVSAQDASNLLRNPGLEEGSFGQYLGRRSGEFPIYLPDGWNHWLAPSNAERFNRGDRTSIQPHPGPGPSPHQGNRAVNVDCGYFTCTAALYQQVSNVADKTNVQASAWAQVKACNLGGGTSCGSAVESGSQTRIGIDPNGGTDPNDSDIVWSAWQQPHDTWLQMSVSATTTGTTVTLFLYSTQSSFADLNKTYWDDVVLSGGGAGGVSAGATPAVPPTATPPPFVAFVVPQGEQDDGSIVHTVQSGDTIDSIAYAYGVTRSQILELNGIADGRIIQLGQKLIIKKADAPPPAAGIGAEPSGEESETTDEAPAGDAPAAEEPAAAGGEADAEATGEAAAPTEIPATPTPAPTAPVVVAADSALNPAATTGSVCVTLFNDTNQNRIQEPGEVLLGGGTIALTQGGQSLDSYETDGTTDLYCFEDLAPGDYIALAGAPSGFGLTTPDQLRLQLRPGPAVNLAFGAAEGLQPAAPPPADAGPLVEEVSAEEAPASSLGDQIMNISGLLIFGLAAVVLIGGAGAALLLRRR